MENIETITDMSLWVTGVIAAVLTIADVILRNEKLAKISNKALFISISLLPNILIVLAVALLSAPDSGFWPPALALAAFVSRSALFIFSTPGNLRISIVELIFYGAALSYTIFSSMFSKHLRAFSDLLESLS